MKPKMINKTVFSEHNDPPMFEDLKDLPPVKYPLSKFDNDLFDEANNIKHKVIRVKATYSTQKGDRWRIFEDNKVVCIIEGMKLSKKERTFLKTADGMIWLIALAKVGVPPLNLLKAAIKQKIAGA